MTCSGGVPLKLFKLLRSNQALLWSQLSPENTVRDFPDSHAVSGIAAYTNSEQGRDSNTELLYSTF